MAELTPVSLAGPALTVLAGLLLGNARDIELVLRMGWESTRDGQVRTVPVMAVRHAQ